MSDFVQQLREETAGVRLTLSRPGITKALSMPQRVKAADQFNANPERLRASKRIIDTGNKAYRDCTLALYRAKHYWIIQTIDYPINGIRLIRRELLDQFNAQMEAYRSQLAEAAAVLRGAYADLKAAAQQQLGDLYDPADYPGDMAGEFRIAWEFPSVEPPDYLKDLNPALYEQQQRLIAERLELAIHAAEQSFASDLQKLVANLADKLTGAGDDGKPKQLSKRAVDAFESFFDRFRTMKLTSNEQLNEVVAQAEQIIKGVDLNAVKDPASGSRGALAEQLSKVAEAVGGLIVEAPTRAYSFDEDEPAAELEAVA
jgi:ElaB/YqjD/DUF883 family membrane-anchored ribosome-binding protein